jgi:hypothetical protein
MTTKITTVNISDAALSTISGGVKISNIVSTDSSYDPLETNTVSTSGGYIKITGTGMTANSQVHLQSGSTYTLATTVTYISATEIRSQLPAKAAGSYNVFVTRNDGAFAVRVNGVTYA